MDLQNQQRIVDAAEKYGAGNCVVILGSSDAEGAEIYAETVTNGDPTFAGPLAGVPWDSRYTTFLMKRSVLNAMKRSGKNRYL